MKLPIQGQPINRKVSSLKIATGTTHNFQLSGIQLDQCLANCRGKKGTARVACVFACKLKDGIGGFPGR